MDKETFIKYLNTRVYKNLPAHVKNYQDVEYLDLVGYSESCKTWDAIKNLINWRKKRVADLGCFLGYFSFKAAHMGANIVGFDCSERFLRAARILNDIYGLKVVFKKWSSGQPISSEFEVALCLNVLHHFKKPKENLRVINSRQVIFLVRNEDVPVVEEFYSIEKKIQSHRENRVILYAKKMSREVGRKNFRLSM